MNLKLTKYSHWQLSGRLVCDLGRLDLTVSRQVYRKVIASKHASKQASMQVSGSNQVHRLIGIRIFNSSW